MIKTLFTAARSYFLGMRGYGQGTWPHLFVFWDFLADKTLQKYLSKRFQ